MAHTGSCGSLDHLNYNCDTLCDDEGARQYCGSDGNTYGSYIKKYVCLCVCARACVRACVRVCVVCEDLAGEGRAVSLTLIIVLLLFACLCLYAFVCAMMFYFKKIRI